MGLLNSFWKLILESAPFLILGLTLSGFIHSFISIDKIKKLLGKNKFSDIFLAAFIGVPLPLCSCSVIPTAATLRKSGASNAATSSFLISTPESGVDSISVTYALMDLPMTIFRPIAAFLSAVVAGISHQFLNDFEFKDEEEEKKSCCHKRKKESENVFVKSFKYSFHDLSNDIAGWLFLGLLVGAFIDFFLPAESLGNIDPLLSKFLIMLVGVPLYICASATTPIAASLILKGMSPGTALILLLVGPATNISNILVMQKYIGKKGVLINIFSIVSVAFLSGVFVDLFYEGFPLNIKLADAHHHHSTIEWWQTLSAIFLCGLIVKGIYQKHGRNIFNRK